MHGRFNADAASQRLLDDVPSHPVNDGCDSSQGLLIACIVRYNTLALQSSATSNGWACATSMRAIALVPCRHHLRSEAVRSSGVLCVDQHMSVAALSAAGDHHQQRAWLSMA